MTARIEKKTTGAAAPRTNAVGAAKSQASKAVRAAANLFTGAAQNVSERLSPGGRPVSVSASASELWGDGSQAVAQALVKLVPQMREQRVGELQAEKAELEGKIGERMGELESKWRRVGPKKKEMALREFVENNEIPASERQKIQVIIDKGSKLDAKVMSLAAELKRTYPAKTPAEDASRREIKKELVELRREQKALMNEAKAIIDATGHGAALLCDAEEHIDPNAPPEESLWSMMSRWLHLTSTVDFFMEFYKKDSKRQQEALVQAQILDDHFKSLEKNGFARADLGMITAGFGAKTRAA